MPPCSNWGLGEQVSLFSPHVLDVWKVTKQPVQEMTFETFRNTVSMCTVSCYSNTRFATLYLSLMCFPEHQQVLFILVISHNSPTTKTTYTATHQSGYMGVQTQQATRRLNTPHNKHGSQPSQHKSFKQIRLSIHCVRRVWTGIQARQCLKFFFYKGLFKKGEKELWDFYTIIFSHLFAVLGVMVVWQISTSVTVVLRAMEVHENTFTLLIWAHYNYYYCQLLVCVLCFLLRLDHIDIKFTVLTDTDNLMLINVIPMFSYFTDMLNRLCWGDSWSYGTSAVPPLHFLSFSNNKKLFK